jgi:ubiquinone/menaquinone biosynthesis C-methylase UbiE
LSQLKLAFYLILASANWICAQPRHPVSGRVIAGVMSADGASWLERSERESEEQPSKAIQSLGLRPGMIVADIGAGTGYYAVRMARAVAPEGKVYAVDIQPRMLELLRRKLELSRIFNVVPVLGAEGDPKLAPASQDLILMVDVYHELAQPQEMLRAIRTALKDDGRLVLIEFRKEDPGVPIRPEHKMSVEEVRIEMEHDGFVIDKVVGILPWQHIIFCRKKL